MNPCDKVFNFINYVENTSFKPLNVQGKKTLKEAQDISDLIQSLNWQDKNLVFTRIRETQRKLFQQLGPSPQNVFSEKTIKKIQEAKEKMVLLKVLLYGSDLTKIPSVNRFKVLVDLANLRAKTIVKGTKYPKEIKILQRELREMKFDKRTREEKERRLIDLKEKMHALESAGTKPKTVTVGNNTFTLWRVPETYLFIGSSDTPSSITEFADKLFKSTYYKTCSISAVTENTGFFQENRRIFLIMSVNPDVIVHTQEKDIRTPRFSEDSKGQKTEWYHLARRNIRVAGKADSAYRSFIGVCLPYIFNEKPTMDPVTTDLDRLVRLRTQLGKLPNCVIKKIVEDKKLIKKNFLDAYQRLELLSPFKEQLKDIDIKDLKNILEECGYGYCSRQECTRRDSVLGNMVNVGTELKLSLEEQKLLLEEILFQRISKNLSSEKNQQLKELLHNRRKLYNLSRTLERLETTEQKEITTKLLFLEKIRELQNIGSFSVLSEQQQVLENQYLICLKEYLREIKKKIENDTYLGRIYYAQEFLPSDIDKILLNEKDREKSFAELEKGIQKIKQNIKEDNKQSLNLKRINQNIEAVDLRLQKEFEELLQKEVDNEEVERFLQCHNHLKEIDAFKVSEQQLDEDFALFEPYRRLTENVSMQILQNQLLDAIDTVPNENGKKCIKQAIAILRNEQKPLSKNEVRDMDEDLRDVIFYLPFLNSDATALEYILMGQKDKLIDTVFRKKDIISEIENNPHSINRSKFQLFNLMSWIKEREEKLEGDNNTAFRKNVYITLFGEKDITGKYDILKKLNLLNKEIRDLPKDLGESPEGAKFIPSPERLMGPQELASQTHRAITRWGFDWNEINLDLEACGGRQGGVFPIGFLLNEKILKKLKPSELESILVYAQKKDLPVFVR